MLAQHGRDACTTRIDGSRCRATCRDRLMGDLHARCSHYDGFDRHKGYTSREHLDALRRHGPCPQHRRRSFAPVMRTSAIGLNAAWPGVWAAEAAGSGAR